MAKNKVTKKSPRPKVTAFHFCDQVIIEETSRKFSLIGIINSVALGNKELFVFFRVQGLQKQDSVELKVSSKPDSERRSKTIGQFTFVIDKSIQEISAEESHFSTNFTVNAGEIGEIYFDVMVNEKRISRNTLRVYSK